MHIQRATDLAPPMAEYVHRIQLAAYSVEAHLIGHDGIPALHESAADMLTHRLSWLLALDDGMLVGAAGYRIVAGVESSTDRDTGEQQTGVEEFLDIDRLVIDPNMFRRGIGRALVNELLAEAGSRPVVVSTGRDNHPARRLYVGSDFELLDEIEVIPGLFIVRYRHRARPGSLNRDSRTKGDPCPGAAPA
jgi:ribosomal protein S18 acetylase RimI-like enzyme